MGGCCPGLPKLCCFCLLLYPVYVNIWHLVLLNNVNIHIICCQIMTTVHGMTFMSHYFKFLDRNGWNERFRCLPLAGWCECKKKKKAWWQWTRQAGRCLKLLFIHPITHSSKMDKLTDYVFNISKYRTAWYVTDHCVIITVLMHYISPKDVACLS